MSKKTENAITPTREDDYPEWYQQVIKAAELAENSSVRGCMVVKPWGYGIWELLQRELDNRIKATGHENAYFPLFIPLSYLQKEAEHVEGFAKECAVVTHHRLEMRDGELVPAGPLEEPLIVRPTSETIIGESFAKWVQSYRDLPLLINQWANVVRWEMRPRLFLRTAEFLWQEGHTAHASESEALQEVKTALGMYQDVLENVLAIPVIPGEKTEGERFPGAELTYTVEAMMQDRKALQAGTSHYLGQNFARAANIKFLNTAGELELAYTTSWGVSTRLIGGMIMTHGDDDGLRVPPKVAPKQVIILPVIPKDGDQDAVMSYAQTLAEEIRSTAYDGNQIRVHVDARDLRGGEKSWQWVKRGAPVRLEVGPRDIEGNGAMLSRRDKGVKDKEKVGRDGIGERIAGILTEMQANYYSQALQYRDANIIDSVKSLGDLQAVFSQKNKGKPELLGGFVRAKWAGGKAEEATLAEMKLSIRCIPFEQSETSGRCILTGKETATDVLIARSY
jgi:prolyl-tRNA synthetase